jgi:hypothetical protein
VGGGHLRGHRARRSHCGCDLVDRRRCEGTAGAAARQLPVVYAVRRDADPVAGGDAERHGDHVVDDNEPHAVAHGVQPCAGELSDAAAAALVDARANGVGDNDDHGLQHGVDRDHFEHDIDLVVDDDRERDARSLTVFTSLCNGR